MKKLLSLLASILLAAPALAAVDLVGDDTDLFTLNPNIPSQIPNVLIILDNTSNWSAANQQWPQIVDPACTSGFLTSSNMKQGNAEGCALFKTIANLDEQVNVGLMMYEGRSQDGGYVRFPMLPMNSTNKTAFQNVLIGMSLSGDSGPSAATEVNLMNDAFRYFNSYGTFTGVAAGQVGGPPVPGADARGYTSSAMTTYQFLASTKDNSCGYDYVIWIGNGFPSNDSATPGITQAAALYNDPNVSVNTTPINNIQGKTVQADIWSRFMFTYGVKTGVDTTNNNAGIYRHITTYTIDVCNAACDANQATLLKSMADVSQGKYFRATNMSAIETALKQIFQEVQAVNSVFAATTLPVSINVRGTNLNQVYIGVFRPDPAQSPRWLGNLKQYQLGVLNSSTGQLGLVDANNVQAVNLNTGFISNTASSIWTDTSTFWSFRSPFANTDAGGASDKPDGDLVEKGGAAQKVRQVYAFPDSTTAMTRNIYTCTGTCASGSPLQNYLFNASNTDITAAALGTFASTPVDLLTGSGSTATATIKAGQTFAAGDSIVIAGAVPALYNGTFTVLSTPAPTATQFSYSVSPNTIDTTHAYVTLPGYTLRPGTDKVTVTATTVGYGVTSSAISAVVGNINQFSYQLPGPTYPTTSASGYTVTAIQQVANVTAPATTPNMVWNSSGTVTVTMPIAHGYSSADAVTVTGAVQSDGLTPEGAFNVVNATITKLDANRFTFTTVVTPAAAPSVTTASAVTADPNVSPNAFTWAAGQTVLVCRTGFTGTPATGCSTADSFNTSSSGASVTQPGGTSFNYSTSGNVSGATAPANSYLAKLINTGTDINTWVLSAASFASSGSNGTMTLTLGTQSNPVASQLPHTLVVGDSITIPAGVLICKKNTSFLRCDTGASLANSSAATAVTYTVTVASFSAGGAPQFAVTTNQINSVTVSSSNPSPTITWTPTASNPSFSKVVNISTLTPGTATVNASGTIYVSKLGDLTSKVTSISSQGNATGSITAAAATSADPNERANLIAWVRGMDNFDNEDRNADPTDVRTSVHGDVLHSRPAVVNYNRNGDDNDVFVFYGANDGMLHAIKGAAEASGGGKEQWAFIPPEFFGKLRRLRVQNPSISSFTPRDYFFDGPIGVYTLDANKDGKLNAADGDKVYLFIASRRGGRMMYALDVSDPANPKLLWKKGCKQPTGTGTTGGCDTGFDEIGQTWSEPKLGYLKKFPTTLALMIGAGYDNPAEIAQPCFISDWNATSVTYLTGVVPPVPMDPTHCPPSGGSSTSATRSMGRGILILNALTGAVLWRAGPDASADAQVTGMNYAIPGDLAVLRNRANTGGRANDIGTESVPIGYMDRIYASDTGGNIWRIDVSDTSSPAAFAVTKLASIAVGPQSGTHPALNYRKLMFNPDVVYSSDVKGDYDAVLVGSGDREHPFDMVVQNRFYMFKDRSTGSLTVAAISSPNSPPATITDTSTSTDLFDVTNNCLQFNNCATGSGQSALDNAKGWRLQLVNIGEKTIATATTSAGSVIFNTNQPKEDTSTTGQSSKAACTSDLGTARQYGLNFQNATATNIFNSLPTQYVEGSGRDARFAGGGFLPTPVPVVVQIGGKYYQTVIAGVQTTNPGGLKLQSRLRTYWYRKTD